VELQRSLGVEVETLRPEEAAALVPGVNVEGVIGATFGPRDGIADPAGLTQGYATLARNAGVTVALGEPVEAIVAGDGAGAGVRTRGGTVAASAVVLAAGAWSGALAATADVDLPVEPVPRV